jgi:hypothetical protein
MTLVEAQAGLAAWEKASIAASNGQGYSIDNVTVTKPNPLHIKEMIKFYKSEIKSLSSGGGIRVRRVVPR